MSEDEKGPPWLWILWVAVGPPAWFIRVHMIHDCWRWFILSSFEAAPAVTHWQVFAALMFFLVIRPVPPIARLKSSSDMKIAEPLTKIFIPLLAWGIAGLVYLVLFS